MIVFGCSQLYWFFFICFFVVREKEGVCLVVVLVVLFALCWVGLVCFRLFYVALSCSVFSMFLVVMWFIQVSSG